MHSRYWRSDCPLHAKTFIPSEDRNAAISFCVDKGFAEQIAMSAPKIFAVIISTDVSFVMCKQNPNL